MDYGEIETIAGRERKISDKIEMEIDKIKNQATISIKEIIEMDISSMEMVAAVKTITYLLVKEFVDLDKRFMGVVIDMMNKGERK